MVVTTVVYQVKNNSKSICKDDEHKSISSWRKRRDGPITHLDTKSENPLQGDYEESAKTQDP